MTAGLRLSLGPVVLIVLAIGHRVVSIPAIFLLVAATVRLVTVLSSVLVVVVVVITVTSGVGVLASFRVMVFTRLLSTAVLLRLEVEVVICVLL